MNTLDRVYEARKSCQDKMEAADTRCVVSSRLEPAKQYSEIDEQMATLAVLLEEQTTLIHKLTESLGSVLSPPHTDTSENRLTDITPLSVLAFNLRAKAAHVKSSNESLHDLISRVML